MNVKNILKGINARLIRDGKKYEHANNDCVNFWLLTKNKCKTRDCDYVLKN